MTCEDTVAEPTPATESAHHAAVPGRLAQGITAVIVAAALAHTAIVGLWALPATPVSDAVGRQTLSSYVLPWWEQSWSIFAPIPLRADWTLRVRAKVEAPGSGRIRVTPWSDVAARPSTNPSRASLAPRLIVRSSNDDLQIRFATWYARSINTGRVVAVEFEAGYRRVPRYDGHAIDFGRVQPSLVSSGWRAPR